MATEDIATIVWPKQELSDTAKWEHHLNVVRWLCALGTVTKWLEGEQGKDTYVRFPYHYLIDGVRVQFLPHWGFWIVDNLDHEVPATEEELRTAIKRKAGV
jgi:hypothetical protein